jgi:membrane-associated phospholipid phosphatase
MEIHRKVVTRGAPRRLPLLVGALGLSLSLQAQNVRLNFEPLLRSASASQPSGQPLDVPCRQTYLQSSDRVVEPYTALNYSLSPGSKHDRESGDRFGSCAPGATPSMLFPGPTAASSSGSGVGAEGEEARQVSWRVVFPNFASDQKRIWLFPFHLAEGQHWKPTLAVASITAGLIALDPHDAPYFRRTNNFATFHQVFKVTTTERVFLGLPVAEYFFGLARHNSYDEQTGFFAAEALADVDVLAGVMRSVDGRLHPRDISPYCDFTHTWFKAKGTYVNRGSFPSGHAAGAFAVATIFSRRYGKRHPWVPIVAYGLATVTCFERITSSAHFPSDVFLGGTLAYTISRYVVLREPGRWGPAFQ